MNILDIPKLTFPSKVTLTPYWMKVTLDSVNGGATRLTRNDGLVSKSWDLLNNLKLTHPVKNGPNEGYLTITHENFVHLQQWMWEYSISCFNNPFDVLAFGVSEYEAWLTFVKDVDLTKTVNNREEFIEFCKEVLTSGIIIKSISVNEDIVIDNIPWDEQGVYNGIRATPMIEANGRISNTIKFSPITKIGFTKTLGIGKLILDLTKDVLLLKNKIYPIFKDGVYVFTHCPACGSETFRQNTLNASYEICDNVSCPSITSGFIESIANQTQLPYDVIASHYSEGSYVSYSGSTVEQQSRQEIGISRLRTMLDVVGRGGLAEVIDYIYPTGGDKPLNIRLEAVDDLINTYIANRNDGVHAALDIYESPKYLKVLLLGFNEPHTLFGMEMLLSKLNITITNVVEEATIVFVAYREFDSVDDEFLDYVKESTNKYIYNTYGDVKALMTELKKLSAIHYLSD